jgi:hypothetical protein
MKRGLTFLLIIYSTISYGQTHLNVLNGLGTISEPGYDAHNTTKVSLLTDITDRFSLSFGANFMSTKKIHDRKEFFYCDSFEPQNDWYRKCADGHDSVVSSAFYRQYKKTELGLHALWRSGTNKHSLTGIGIVGVFLTRQQIIEDDLFEDERPETANGIAVTAMHMQEFPLFKPDSDISLIITGQGGIFYSPQDQCTDINCDNFLDGPLHFIGSLQVGLSLALN